jgi:hypothetical protein
MFSGGVFPVPCRERTGEFSNCPFGLLQSLLQLLHKSYSDSAPFQEALEVLRVSHTSTHLKKKIKKEKEMSWESTISGSQSRHDSNVKMLIS